MLGDNPFTFHVFKESGAYHCFRCGAKGNLWKFKQLVSEIDSFTASFSEGVESGGEVTIPKAVSKRALPRDVPQYPLDLVREEGFGVEVLEYLEKERGLELETLLRFGCGACERKFYHQDSATWKEEPCVTFPWIDGTDVKRVKLRSVRTKSNTRIEPKGSQEWAFFGGGVVVTEEKTKEVVITEGEFDAMSVFQATGMETLSLPNGASSLPPPLLPLLESYSTIYLWLDDDDAGHAGTERFVRKLGPRRCRIIRSDENDAQKDANDVLRYQGAWKVRDLIRNAIAPSHSKLKTVRDYHSEIMTELIHPDQFAGIPVTSMKTLQGYVRGIRRGEFSLLTGGTGTGKTTLASQLSLDIAQQRIPTLWGSFEIKNSKLIIKMLRQKYQRKAPALKHQTGTLTTPLLEGSDASFLHRLLEDFEELPMHFMSFHGATAVDAIIDAMDFARYVHDIHVYFLDNLQFMTDISGSGDFARFAAQDKVITKLRHFATENDVHIFMIVHPRKEAPEKKLTIQSIFGTGKVTQEADNVLILNDCHRPGTAETWPPQKDDSQPPPPPPKDDQKYKTLDIAKNREAGQLGSVSLKFDTDSQRYFEIGTFGQGSSSSSSGSTQESSTSS